MPPPELKTSAAKRGGAGRARSVRRVRSETTETMMPSTNTSGTSMSQPGHNQDAVMTFLGNEHASHLYTPGMTIEEAEKAVIQDLVTTRLRNEQASHLYTPGMTIEQAEQAVKRSKMGAVPIVVVSPRKAPRV